MFTLVSLAGLALVVVGYRMADRGEQLFAPWPAAIATAPYAVTLAFVLFAAANMRTHIRRAVQHPMLLGLLVWSVAHLLANGDARGTVLFGAFAAYAIGDLISAVNRRAVKTFTPTAAHDAIAIAVGIALALLVMRYVGPLLGHSVVPVRRLTRRRSGLQPAGVRATSTHARFACEATHASMNAIVCAPSSIVG